MSEFFCKSFDVTAEMSNDPLRREGQQALTRVQLIVKPRNKTVPGKIDIKPKGPQWRITARRCLLWVCSLSSTARINFSIKFYCRALEKIYIILSHQWLDVHSKIRTHCAKYCLSIYHKARRMKVRPNQKNPSPPPSLKQTEVFTQLYNAHVHLKHRNYWKRFFYF